MNFESGPSEKARFVAAVFSGYSPRTLPGVKGAPGFECRTGGPGGGEASDGLKNFTKVRSKFYFRSQTDVQLHSKTLAHCARQKKRNLFVIVCHRPTL